MKQIESAINPGMTQSNVIRMLGQPLWWDTNTNGTVATYMFGSPMVGFDILTNGFRIEFSNAVVVRKLPITVLSSDRTNE